MAKTLVLIYGIVTDLVILSSFIFSVRYFKELKKYRYLKLFPIYTAISFLVDLVGYFNKSFGTMATNLFVPFEFVMFYIFFGRVLDDKRNLKTLCILGSLYVVFFLIMLIIQYDKDHLSLLKLFEKRVYLDFVLVSYILIVLPIILYYKSLFSSVSLNLNKDPVFLIMTGIMFGFSLIIPINTFHLVVRHNSIETYLYFYILNAFGYIFMHLFFIKAYTIIR